MRETESIEPMWEEPTSPGLGARAWGLALTLGAGAAKRLTPHLAGWARGMHPGLVVRWGSGEYDFGRRMRTRRRSEGEGWDDNPRTNYNDAVRKRQDRDQSKNLAAAEADLSAARERLEALEREHRKATSNAKSAWTRVKTVNAELKALKEARDSADAPEPLDLSEASMQAAVAAKMGLAGGSPEGHEVSRDPDLLKEELAGVRATLQALDDVGDWNLLEAADEELYQLHKAVEYKLRNHKSSEAKAKLEGLFKS